MEKTINLGGKQLKLASSLFTIICYQNVFGTDLFDDVASLDKKADSAEGNSQVINVLFKLFYILHKPYTDKSFEEFLMEIPFEVLSNEKELNILTNTITNLLSPLAKKGKNGGNQSPKH